MRVSGRLILSAITLTALPLLVLSCRVPTQPSDDSGSVRRAELLFGRFCSVCHGPRGAGDGLPAGTLVPPPRDFGAGLFSLVSTENGLPTDSDIESVLRRGIPGSSMPSFAWLPDADIRSLAGHVRELVVHEMANRIAEVEPSAAAESSALDRAQKWFTPGRPIEVPKPAMPTPAILQRGKNVYLRLCAACHGDQGTGRQPIAHWAGRKTIQWARDFTSGIMKGGTSHTELSNRIRGGMPGSAMPPNSLPDEGEFAALIAYVKSLIPSDSADRLVQKQQTIRVVKRNGRLNLTVSDTQWKDIPATNLVLSPMRWRRDPIVHATVQAAHDGQTIEFRVSWADANRDQPALGEVGPSDRVALQFTNDPGASFFGMGSKRHPVSIWYWHPRPLKQTVGELDLLTSPHGTLSDATPIVALPVRARELTARGHGSAAGFRGQDRKVAANARWADGRWSVVFRRAMPKETEADTVIRFDTDTTIRLALAIWDGKVSADPSDKSFTIWHRLVIE